MAISYRYAGLICEAVPQGRNNLEIRFHGRCLVNGGPPLIYIRNPHNTLNDETLIVALTQTMASVLDQCNDELGVVQRYAHYNYQNLQNMDGLSLVHFYVCRAVIKMFGKEDVFQEVPPTIPIDAIPLYLCDSEAKEQIMRMKL